MKVTSPNRASPVKVAPLNRVLAVKVAPPKTASLVKVASSNRASPVKVAPPKTALPVKVAPSNQALPMWAWLVVGLCRAVSNRCSRSSVKGVPRWSMTAPGVRAFR